MVAKTRKGFQLRRVYGQERSRSWSSNRRWVQVPTVVLRLAMKLPLTRTKKDLSPIPSQCQPLKTDAFGFFSEWNWNCYCNCYECKLKVYKSNKFHLSCFNFASGRFFVLAFRLPFCISKLLLIVELLARAFLMQSAQLEILRLSLFSSLCVSEKCIFIKILLIRMAFSFLFFYALLF